VGFAAVVVILACTSCAALGSSESELASQTQVVQQAAPLSATGVPSPSPTTEQPVPVGTEVGGGEVAGFGPCELIAVNDVTVYERPHTTAAVFGAMVEGYRVQPQARTADGWWGFDPGVAQAANVGVFRLRWVQETASVRLEGSSSRRVFHDAHGGRAGPGQPRSLGRGDGDVGAWRLRRSAGHQHGRMGAGRPGLRQYGTCRQRVGAGWYSQHERAVREPADGGASVKHAKVLSHADDVRGWTSTAGVY
jgi:hypothetical protein